MAIITKAVFLDRDGVINQDPPHYAHRIDQLSLIERSGPAIRMIRENGFIIIVITNQSGIARGMYTEGEMHAFNNALLEMLTYYGATVNEIFFCPHHPDAKVEKYRLDCPCRKPKAGMLIEAGKKFNIDYHSSFLVGDKWSDIEAGRTVGCKTILVKTGHGLGELERESHPVDYIAVDLFDAVQNFILLTEK